MGGLLRVAVVGCGYWGSKHLRVLQGLSEVDEVLAVDARADRRSALSKSFSGVRACADLDSALEATDAVVISTPPSTHVDLALRAIAAGKHVLVEKPLATTAAGARRLIEEARANSVTLMVGHTFEYNAAVWKLQELIQSSELGRLYYLDSARLNLGLYQSNVNVLWDLAPHDISIANYVLGAAPTSVQAWAYKHAHRYLEDVAYLALRYEQIEVNAHIHVSWLDPCKVRRVTAVGSRKMAVYNDLATEERIRIFDKGVVASEMGQSTPDVPMSYRYGDITSPFLNFEEPLAVQDRHFVDCAQSGKQPRTDGYNGLAVVEVLEAARVSALEGRPVRLDELADGQLTEQLHVQTLMAARN